MIRDPRVILTLMAVWALVALAMWVLGRAPT